MKFENKELGVSFEIEDVITVPMQMIYLGLADSVSITQKYINMWNAARIYVKEWKFEAFPDPLAAYNDETDTNISKAFIWAGQEVYDYITGLSEAPND